MTSGSSREFRAPKGSGPFSFSIIVLAAVLLVTISGGPLSATTHDSVQISALKSSAAVPGSVLFIPASAHVEGDNNTSWRTDLELHNPGRAAATVTLSLLRFRQSNLNPSQRTYTLDPGESLQLADVLHSVFGLDGAAALRITNDVGMVAVTSRTYTPSNTSAGTFGQFVGGVLDFTAIQAGEEGRIIQLTHNRSLDSGFRTNIGFVNTTAGSITVQIDLYSASGAFLGTKSYAANPYEFRQIDKIFTKVTSAEVPDGYAVLSTPTAGGAFFGYATVIDNRTGDPVYITAEIRSGGGTTPAPTPTPTSSSTPSPTPTSTPTPTATPTPPPAPNLAPYQPDGWSGPLVVSGTEGSRTSGGLSASGTTYFSGAIANFGPGDAVFPANSILADLGLDSSVIATLDAPSTLAAYEYVYFTDYAVTGISSGTHVASLVADPDNDISEESEGDNSWSYNGSWGAKSTTIPRTRTKARPQIRIGQMPGWDSSSSPGRVLPQGLEWLGEPPLKQGLMDKSGLKAVSEPDPAKYIPGTAHVTGSNNANWRTDVQLHNPGAVQARAELALLVRDEPNPSPQTTTITVAAGASRRLEDVLYSSFGFTGAAALRITVLAGDIIATSRTYNLNLTNGETFGLYAASVNGSTAFVAGERALLMQLSHSASNATGFRANVGMLNLTSQTITLDLDFRTADGTSLGTGSYDLEPYEFYQKDKIFRTVTSSSVSDGYIIITSQTSGARYLAYATVIDNPTGDSIFIPAIPVLASEPTAAALVPAAEAAFSALSLIGQGTIPSVETVVGTIQSMGMEGFLSTLSGYAPAGVVTPINQGLTVNLGSHFVAQTGDVLAGSATFTYENLVNTPGTLSYDYAVVGESPMWNGQYAEVAGVEGEMDLAIDSQSHVRGGVSMQSISLDHSKSGKALSDVSFSGSVEFDSEICANYPIGGSVTVTKDGEDYTISFNDNCDGTFEGGSQGQTGDVSFRLTWSGPQDLDIYVQEPSGEIIYYSNSDSATNGELDVDSNAGCSGPDQSPTENVFWPVGSAPHGTYSFWARRWSSCSATDTPAFTLRVFEGETVVRTINGTMPSSGETEHYTHVY